MPGREPLNVTMSGSETYDVTFEEMTPEHYLALFMSVQEYHRQAHALQSSGLMTDDDVDISHDLLDYMLEVDEELIARAEDSAGDRVEDIVGKPTGNPAIDMIRALGGEAEIIFSDLSDPEDGRF